MKYLQKVKKEQERALDKMSNENEFLVKMKALMAQLSLASKRNEEYEERQRRSEKTLKFY